jgi:hypothetical protein
VVAERREAVIRKKQEKVAVSGGVQVFVLEKFRGRKGLALRLFWNVDITISPRVVLKLPAWIR